jgi:hypothetical protein
MPIQDSSGNPFYTDSSPMIGWQPPAEVPEPLNLEMYKFFIDVIRQEDQINGNLFLKRFLQGPQETWKFITNLALSVPKLWNVSEVNDRFLPYLKNIVGWTADLNSITDRLTPLQLRRLIAASVPFWKRRGPEDATADILRFVTAARVRIWNWFDWRVVSDETAFGVDFNGFDPWMISVADDSVYNIRIVDDGTLDHQLVRDLARLTRPIGETVEISYVGFMDLFNTDYDDSQWGAETDPYNSGDDFSELTALSGVFTVEPSTPGQMAESAVSLPGATDWIDYVVSWRVKGEGARCSFYRTNNGDMYYVVLRAADNMISLRRLAGGVETTLDDVDMATHAVVLDSDIFYAIRVEASPESGQTRIRVYFESVEISNVLNPTHTQGSIGVGHSAGGFVIVDEVELFFNPLQTDTIAPNS